MQDLRKYSDAELYLHFTNTEEVYRNVMHFHLYGSIFDVIEYLRSKYTYTKKQFEVLMVELQADVEDLKHDDDEFYIQFEASLL